MENRKLYCNLHTHTSRCGHAGGSDREYVEAAIAAGFTTLGFSDHVPIPFPEGYRSGCRMDVSKTSDYVNSITALKEEYADRIRLLVGYECEYMPFLFSNTMRNLLRQRSFDYLILGQHFLHNEFDGRGATAGDASEKTFVQYTDRLIEGLQTGVYTYLAHPDIYRFTGDDAVYEREIQRLCAAGKQMNIPFEINFTGIEDGRHYPREAFWEIAGDVGVATVFGVDAHLPKWIDRPVALEKAFAMVDKYHLQWVPVPTIRDPKIPLAALGLTVGA